MFPPRQIEQNPTLTRMIHGLLTEDFQETKKSQQT